MNGNVTYKSIIPFPIFLYENIFPVDVSLVSFWIWPSPYFLKNNHQCKKALLVNNTSKQYLFPIIKKNAAWKPITQDKKYTKITMYK